MQVPLAWYCAKLGLPINSDLLDAAKAVHRGIFVAFNPYIRKEGRSEINDLNF